MQRSFLVFASLFFLNAGICSANLVWAQTSNEPKPFFPNLCCSEVAAGDLEKDKLPPLNDGKLAAAAKDVGAQISKAIERDSRLPKSWTLKLGDPDIWARALVSGGAFGYVLLSKGHSVFESVTLGATAAALSWGFQFWAPVYTHFLTHRGVFQIDLDKKAGFTESMIKEYMAQWLYLGVYAVVSELIGIPNQGLAGTVFSSWIMEGTWSVIIVAYSNYLKSKLGDKSHTPQYFYRAAFLLQALTSSLLIIYSFHGSELADSIMNNMGKVGIGAIVIASLITKWKKIGNSFSRTLHRLKPKAVYESSRDRLALEWGGIKSLWKGITTERSPLRMTCHNALSWVIPFMRTIR